MTHFALSLENNINSLALRSTDKRKVMKKILAYMAIIIAVISLSSCNSLEKKAKRQLRDTMEELAKNPETFKITNEKVVFSNDSMCTISFIGRGQNGFGGYNSSKMEYTFIKLAKDDEGKTTYCEALLDMESQKDRRNSIKEAINDVDKGFLYGSSKAVYDEFIKKGMSKEDAKANYLYFQAMVNSAINGREIDNND
jgi:hypothetical protein